MESSKLNDYSGFNTNELIGIIEKKLVSLKGVINSEDFDFNESKKLVIESLSLIEKHFSDLKEIINKGK